jgi:hypothetical protein
VTGALFPPNVWDTLANVRALTGFQLWDMAWSPVPMAGCCTMGNQVGIDLAYPTDCHMTYQRGIDQDPSRALYTPQHHRKVNAELDQSVASLPT